MCGYSFFALRASYQAGKPTTHIHKPERSTPMRRPGKSCFHRACREHSRGQRTAPIHPAQDPHRYRRCIPRRTSGAPPIEAGWRECRQGRPGRFRRANDEREIPERSILRRRGSRTGTIASEVPSRQSKQSTGGFECEARSWMIAAFGASRNGRRTSVGIGNQHPDGAVLPRGDEDLAVPAAADLKVGAGHCPSHRRLHEFRERHIDPSAAAVAHI